jgi:hypothetical protein
LENILFARSSMTCPSHAIFYITGKCNNKGQFFVYRVIFRQYMLFLQIVEIRY